MLKNYLVTAFREIFKNKIFSFIHIFGLALGIAAFVMILQYAFYELSYERFYDNADQIYRVRQDRYDKGKLSTTWGAGCSAIGPALKNEFPEVLAFGRLTNVGAIVNIKERNFREDKIFAANTSFLTMLPVRLTAGVDSTALDEPNTAVISENTANKYFGNEEAIGQSFTLNGEVVFRITGVFRDIPENTHLKYNILISWPTYANWRGPDIETAWNWDGFYTYIRLREGTDIEEFEKKMNEFTDKQTEEHTRQYDQHAVYSLQPLRSIHLHSDLMWEAEVNGDAKTVYFLMVIACIILIIAWVNYINLSTVKAIFRAREVAMRKISGALRIHLIKQFLVESFVINLIATLLALILILVFMPYLRTLTGRELGIGSLEIWLLLIAMVLAGPLLSGLYPALVISSFRPMTIFRGKFNGASGGDFIRKALVVFQFAASITLIAGTFTVYSQLIYMRNQELGVNIDQTLIIKGPGVADSTYDEKLSAFREELLKYPVIKSISASTTIPGSKVFWNAGGIRLASDDESKSNQYRIIGIDYDFIDAYNLSVVQGRKFSREFGSDEETVLFNEEAIKLMGFETAESAIGEVIYFWGANYRIIGVLKNFHQESLKEKYDAIIFRLTPGTRDFYSIKLNSEGQAGSNSFALSKNTIKTIEDHWERFFPGNPFDYFFLSDHYDQQYRAEKQFRTIFGLFAILAIVIACLGLFGLSWFIIVQRTREIGIRKVNGASVGNILLLVSRDFFKLVILGIVIAAPAIYYLSNKWLEKYPFRIDFNWWLFLLSGLIIILISALTISYNTLAIAHTNPAESIKYE
ncbi:MAG: ABC transporter permease [Bacteroidales bacterium]|nr:ABC transporter permease [Bacteroidales bacterium]